MTAPWQTWSLAEREREYSPSSVIGGDLTDLLNGYRTASLDCKRRFPPVAYAYGSHPDEWLDLYRPATSPPDGLTLHVFIHGGYWQELSRAESSFMAAPLLERGAAVAVIDYTLAPRASLDVIVDQCVRAVTWCSQQSAAWGTRADRLIISGSSAGAHLAAMVLTRVTTVTGAVLLSGIYDLAPLIGTYINDAVGITPDQAERLSPILRAPVRPVPLIVADGAIETAAFHAQGDAFASAWATHGCPVTRLTIPGRNHFDVPYDLGDPASTLGRAVVALAG
ncbi:MAG: alpha/beta hydrolase [Gemmatimonadales bacterium]